ncbi:MULTISPECIES: RagB/SusD family nutrient uptake outer membrane protein [Sphingobacterium]|uniref:RagB/SusD family nutrient uptake outer membrane protein n=1 Tax=Sphingobacterium TaxID=28453 RepID=UPI0016015AAD|nr:MULTISPECIES: RagB/SusD family nutrient uptake outer membrane protein [Sphingobacterium]MBB1646493.1 carbohydrate-binding protein SusD [Sphingobacterium sp. UME9]QRY59487.1 RagB/SusD family nutrient uptake outer membrane protein [Sphingobacterium siyangense]
MKKLTVFKSMVVSGLLFFQSCNYLDVVPDNAPTIDNAFTMRSEAIKYLATCYSYLPNDGEPTINPAFMAGDELWLDYPTRSINGTNWNIARGNQSVTDPYVNYWDGHIINNVRERSMFNAIRDCNIFLENIQNPEKVRDMTQDERTTWEGEVLFLKAYYHFMLMRHYGPIPIMDVNVPVTAPIEETQVKRQPIDQVADYIVKVLDEAASKLPSAVQSPVTDLGHITKPIALGIKAKVLLYAASPLFNGNTDYATFKNVDGTLFFNQSFQAEKWRKAAQAAKEAIAACEELGMNLYEFPTPVRPLSNTTMIQMSIRNAVTEKWNREIIWGNSNSRTWQLQYSSMAHIDPNNAGNNSVNGTLAPTIKIIEQFYTKNGVPMDEDKTLDFSNKNQLRAGTHDERFNNIENYRTARLHFDRENRFYANVGFDGGVWYMENSPSQTDENTWTTQLRLGLFGSGVSVPITTYYPKKLVNWKFAFKDGNSSHIEEYPWPMLRLADLYLMYAEALNESEGPTADVFLYLDKIRKRAGLEGVKESWAKYAFNSAKPTTKEGLRAIIQRERNIEMSFEGSRFWDLRRWKLAAQELNKNITGWDRNQDKDHPELFYQEQTFYQQRFVAPRDYFWPIKESDLLVNPNLVQNPGW